jgi:GLPGLI family protein
MKKLALLFAMTIVTSVMSFAQMEEGHIVYDIEMTSDDPDMAMAVMMFSGSKMNLYFGDNKARTDLDMGTMMSMSTVVDNETEEILILMGGMIGERAVLTNSEEMETDQEEVEEPTVTLTKEKKEIAGYKCKKAIITDADGNEMEYWYTEDIKTVTTDKKAAISKLPGLALQYAVDREGMMMSFTAKTVETSLDKETIKEKLSLEIPEGYEEMTYEEFTSMGM